MCPFEGRQEADGQGMVEYALILILVSIAAVTVLGVVGTTITQEFFEVAANAFP